MKQTNLFNEEDFYEKHWQDMPEFHQEDLTSYRKIIVHFRNEEDVQKFSELLNQKITAKQASLWYPKLQKRSHYDKVFINEND
tara:strand:- start:2133 stop:2381 length:249 start_codon:yes stop_codon:yes gene_type:complete